MTCATHLGNNQKESPIRTLESLLLTFARAALRTKIGPPSRMTTKYGPIFAATRRAGANFPDFVVNRRSKIRHIRRSSLLELEKIGSQRRSWES
jgi:hypothetical protein